MSEMPLEPLQIRQGEVGWQPHRDKTYWSEFRYHRQSAWFPVCLLEQLNEVFFAVCLRLTCCQACQSQAAAKIGSLSCTAEQTGQSQHDSQKNSTRSQAEHARRGYHQDEILKQVWS